MECPEFSPPHSAGIIDGYTMPDSMCAGLQIQQTAEPLNHLPGLPPLLYFICLFILLKGSISRQCFCGQPLVVVELRSASASPMLALNPCASTPSFC